MPDSPQQLKKSIYLIVGKFPEAKRGIVLLPRRWAVERSFAWASRFRRLAYDHERLAGVFASEHVGTFASLTLNRLSPMALSV